MNGFEQGRILGRVDEKMRIYPIGETRALSGPSCPWSARRAKHQMRHPEQIWTSFINCITARTFDYDFERPPTRTCANEHVS